MRMIWSFYVGWICVEGEFRAKKGLLLSGEVSVCSAKKVFPPLFSLVILLMGCFKRSLFNKSINNQ